MLKPVWVLMAIHPDAPTVTRLGSFATRRAAVVTASLLAGRTGSVEICRNAIAARYSQAVTRLVPQS